MIGWIFLGLLVLGVIGLISIYNGLVWKKNAARNAFAQIDVQLKRRYDLIPNLVETVQAYMSHERTTLEAVVAARNSAEAASLRSAGDWSNAQAVQQRAEAEAGLSGTLGRLLAVSESYPELKADQNMRQLTEALTTTENRIAFARQAYNDAVMTLNTALEVFPNSWVAKWSEFKPGILLEATESSEERKAVKISLG